MVKIRHLAMLCLSCFMAACSSGGAPDGAPLSNETIRSGITPSSTSMTNTMWPNLHVQRISDTVNDNEHLIFEGSGTPDGRFFLVKIQSRYAPGFGPNISEQVALYEWSTGTIHIVASALDNRHGVTGFTVDNHWVVWYERGLPEVSNDATWTMYAYNIDTGKTREVERNDQGNGVYPKPQLDQGKLVWNEVNGQVSPDRSSFVVRFLDLNTGYTRTLAQRAGSPVISWPWIGWSQVTMINSQGVAGVEQFTNMVTGETASIQAMAIEKVLVGTSLVYQTSSSDGVTNTFSYIPDIRHLQAGSMTYIVPSISINDITFNGQYVGWHSLGDRDVPMVYDVLHHKIIQLPLQYHSVGTELVISSTAFLLWTEDPNSNTDEEANYSAKHLLPPLVYSFMKLEAIS